MRVVLQRVSEASVTIDQKIKGKIGLGILILLGIEEEDSNQDIEWLVALFLPDIFSCFQYQKSICHHLVCHQHPLRYCAFYAALCKMSFDGISFYQL